MEMKTLMTGIILAALILAFSLSTILAQDANIYDRDWSLAGRMRGGKIYVLDMKLEGYIKDFRIYDQYLMPKGYVEGNRIFDQNRYVQGYIKKEDGGTATEEGKSESR